MNWHLLRLAARRVWSPATVAASAALLAVLAFLGRAPVGELGAGRERPGAEFADRLLLAACLCVPLALWPAAQTFRHWRRGECDWLAGVVASPWKVLATWWAGTGAAACALIALAVLIASVGPGATAPVRERLQQFTHPFVLLGGTQLHWSTTLSLEPRADQAGAVLGIHPRSIGAAPAATLFARARRQAAVPKAANALESQASQRVFAARHLELELPSGQGPLELELWIDGGDALISIDRDSLLLASGASEPAWRAATRWTLGLSAVVLAATALALGLGAWLRPATGLCAVLAMALAAELATRRWPELAPWLPWSAAKEQWQHLRSGLFLADQLGCALLGAAFCVAAGIALGSIRPPNWSRES